MYIKLVQRRKVICSQNQLLSFCYQYFRSIRDFLFQVGVADEIARNEGTDWHRAGLQGRGHQGSLLGRHQADLRGGRNPTRVGLRGDAVPAHGHTLFQALATAKSRDLPAVRLRQRQTVLGALRGHVHRRGERPDDTLPVKSDEGRLARGIGAGGTELCGQHVNVCICT